MSKMEAIAQFCRIAEQLSEEELQAVLDYSSYMAGPSVYSTLSEADKASINRGLADKQAGRVVDGDVAHAAIRQRIANARR
jgi:predicted transcriptional regulator